MLRVAVLLAAAAAAAAAPACYDDSGNAVDWFVAIKDNNGGDYAMATSDSPSMRQSSHNMQDGSSGGISKTVAQMWDTRYSRGAYNDEPGYKASSKYGHTKGFIAADGEAGIWVVHSIPNWPLFTDASYGGLPDNETKYAQSLLCISLSTSDINGTVANALLHNRPAVYMNNITSSDKYALSGLGNALSEAYINADSTLDAPVTSLGGTTFTVFAKTAKWADDLYSHLVAPSLRASLWVETWIRGGNIGPVCDGPYTVVDVTSVTFAGESWNETQDHSKWAVATPEGGSAWTCIGDINRMTSQRKRGGGTVCFKNTAVWNTFTAAATAHGSCSAPALRGAAV